LIDRLTSSGIYRYSGREDGHQSVSITTKVVSSATVHGEVYSIQHNVIKCVSDPRKVNGFLRILRFPPSTKLTAKK